MAGNEENTGAELEVAMTCNEENTGAELEVAKTCNEENTGAELEVAKTCDENQGVDMTGTMVSTNLESSAKEVTRFKFEIDLKLEEGRKHIVSDNYWWHTSGSNVSNVCGKKASCKWRVELRTDYVDPQTKQRCLSAYLTLVELAEFMDCVEVVFKIDLPGSKDNSPKTYGRRYGRVSSLTKFTRERRTFGFPDFISFIKLGPYGRPNNKEKLKMGVTMYIIENDSESLLSDAEDSDSEGSSKDSSEDSSTDSSEESEEEPVVLNGTIRFGIDSMSVDIKKVQSHTSFFDNYINSPRDLEKIQLFQKNYILLKNVIDFCHNGELNPVPKSIPVLAWTIRVAKFVRIDPLKEFCQLVLMQERLSVETFTRVVKFYIAGVLEDEDDFNVGAMLYKFLMEHKPQLEKNQNYIATYRKYRSFYRDQMLKYESSCAYEKKMRPKMGQIVRRMESSPAGVKGGNNKGGRNDKGPSSLKALVKTGGNDKGPSSLKALVKQVLNRNIPN